MLDSGVEIDGVFGFEQEFFAADFQRKRSLDEKKKFNSGVLMGLQFFGGKVLKFGVKGAQFALCGVKIEAFEKVWDIWRAGTLRKTNAFFAASQRDYPALAFVGKEILEAYAKNQGDAQ